MYVCFLLKQKTAYEMRISDWSSDVCSSDRSGGPAYRPKSTATVLPPLTTMPTRSPGPGRYRPESRAAKAAAPPGSATIRRALHSASCACRIASSETSRSEEHPSELQSLMRISYAVFCLKKKKNTTYNK